MTSSHSLNDARPDRNRQPSPLKNPQAHNRSESRRIIERQTTNPATHSSNARQGPLHEGDFVHVFSRSAEDWVDAEVVELLQGGLLRVEYECAEYWIAKTLHLHSDHLKLPSAAVCDPMSSAWSTMGSTGSCPCTCQTSKTEDAPTCAVVGSNAMRPRKLRERQGDRDANNIKWKYMRKHRTSRTTLPVDLLIDFGLDPFDFSTECMCAFYLQMVQFLGLQESFSLETPTIMSYATNILAKYRDVPYHNSCHAFSITQFLFTCYIKSDPIQLNLTKEDTLAIFVAALAHDCDHPGNNNAWEVATRSPLALKYNDIGVLENHHCAIGAQVMEKANCNMFGTLKATKKDQVLNTFVHAILLTDMAQHFKMVDDLKTRKANSSNFDFQCLEDRRSVAGILLHCVDISNPLLPEFGLCERWAKRINEEFVNQYRSEAEQGLPQTKMWEGIDTDMGFIKSQINFVDFIVAPLWVQVIDIFQDLQSEGRLRDNLESNKSRWVAMKNELEEVPRAQLQKERNVSSQRSRWHQPHA